MVQSTSSSPVKPKAARVSAPVSSKKVETSSSQGKIAVVLVRGLARIIRPIKDTLIMLRLTRKNFCVVLDNTPANRGMISKVKDFVAWGEISPEVLDKLVAARGEIFQGNLQDGKKLYSYKTFQQNNKHYKPYFRLNPPRGGFDRKGIKAAYSTGGAVGHHGKDINDLLLRMI